MPLRKCKHFLKSRMASSFTSPPAAPLLIQKIDLVQQILTFLEGSLATGRQSYVNEVNFIDNTIEGLKREIIELERRKELMGQEFQGFEGAVGVSYWWF